MGSFGASDIYFIITMGVLLPYAVVGSLRDVKLEMPYAVRQGENVVLHCSYDMDGDVLYSVKWYKGRSEFYRYTPEDNPSIRIFPLPRIRVDPYSSNKTHVTLEKVNQWASDEYICEVTTDFPSFRSIMSFGTLEVVKVPDRGPSINGIEYVYRIGDFLQGNCTIGYSSPGTNLTWSINDRVENSSFFDTEVGTRFSEIQFDVTAQHFVGGRMNIKCVAEIYNVYRHWDEIVIDELVEREPLEGLTNITSNSVNLHQNTFYDEILVPDYDVLYDYKNMTRDVEDESSATSACAYIWSSALLLIFCFLSFIVVAKLL